MPNALDAKRTPIIIGAAVVAIAIVAAVIFFATNDNEDSDQASKKDPTLVVKEFNLAGPTSVIALESGLWASPQRLVFRSVADWAAQGLPQDSLRSVDYATQTIIAVSAGQKGSGGNTIAITGARDTGKKVIVDVTETTPGEGCATTQALTKPMQLVEIPATKLPIEFNEKKETTKC